MWQGKRSVNNSFLAVLICFLEMTKRLQGQEAKNSSLKGMMPFPDLFSGNSFTAERDISNKHNRLKNRQRRLADQMAVYRHDQGIQFEPRVYRKTTPT